MRKLCVSNSSCLAQLRFWKQFAPGEVQPLWGAPGPADSSHFLPAASHLHHVFPISPSCAFPFRPVFLAIIAHHHPDAKSPQNPRAFQLDRVSESTKPTPLSYTWAYEGSEKSCSYVVAKSEPEPGSKPSVLFTTCHLRPFKYCTSQPILAQEIPSAQCSAGVHKWFCYVKSVNLCLPSIYPSQESLQKPAPSYVGEHGPNLLLHSAPVTSLLCRKAKEMNKGWKKLHLTSINLGWEDAVWQGKPKLSTWTPVLVGEECVSVTRTLLTLFSQHEKPN